MIGYRLRSSFLEALQVTGIGLLSAQADREGRKRTNGEGYRSKIPGGTGLDEGRETEREARGASRKPAQQGSVVRWEWCSGQWPLRGLRFRSRSLASAPSPSPERRAMLSTKTLQAVGEDENRPTFCSSGDPTDSANCSVLLRF